MGKDYLMLYIKSLVRHGEEIRALDHLVNAKGYNMTDAKAYIARLREIIANEHDD